MIEQSDVKCYRSFKKNLFGKLRMDGSSKFFSLNFSHILFSQNIDMTDLVHAAHGQCFFFLFSGRSASHSSHEDFKQQSGLLEAFHEPLGCVTALLSIFTYCQCI